MSDNSRQCLQAAIASLVLSSCARLNAAAPMASANTDHADLLAALPITAAELMPLEPRCGVYLVTEGPTKGKRVPFTLEQHGDRWVLTKQELARHELHRDQKGNFLIDRETDLREDRQIEYISPIILLPAIVDSHTSLKGATRVIVRNTRSRSVKYRGVCNWQLDFIGVSPIEATLEAVPTYRLRAKRKVQLPLAQISMTINFEYGRGKGMIATDIDQMIRALGLFTHRDIWRLEQLPSDDSNSCSLTQRGTMTQMVWTTSPSQVARTTTTSLDPSLRGIGRFSDRSASEGA